MRVSTHLEPHGEDPFLACKCYTFAVSDALLGAAALGDLGTLFPPGQPETKGISSAILMDKVLKRLAHEGFEVFQMDATLVAQTPPLSSRLDDIRVSLAQILGLARNRLNVKVKSPEGLGALGASQGIAALAIATVVPREVKL